MGLVYSNARFLLEAKSQGTSFDRTITLGRQKLYITPDELNSLTNQYNRGNPVDLASVAFKGYADEFLASFLDVRELHSLDVSDYQQAAIIHDLNEPVEVEQEATYDVVIDGGTLEHVFNFPVAISNCMRLVKEGGSLFLFSVANNHCGHGFYQFSPELFYRIFQEENGFMTKSVVMLKHPYPGVELSRRQRCYSVVDPNSVRRRVRLVTSSPVAIMVHAQRTTCVEPFLTWPQQSDYIRTWQDHTAAAPADGDKRKKTKKKIGRLVPIWAKNWLYGMMQLRTDRFKNRESYSPW